MHFRQNNPLPRNGRRVFPAAFQAAPARGGAAGLVWRRKGAGRLLPVQWLECRNPSAFSLQPSALGLLRKRAFTLLEMMLVIAIIGFLAALALPHMGGFTRASAMAAATRQVLDDITYARQRALVNRSMVCMVFLPADFWTNQWSDQSGFTQVAQGPVYAGVTNLALHQYSAYALISMRTVGDQPGKSNAQYLTDWKYLPQGVFFSPFQLTNSPSSFNYATNWAWTTNTTTGLTNPWSISGFANYGPAAIAFPFPGPYDASYTYTLNQNVPPPTYFLYLPYIAFAPSGQLTTNVDQFILLTSGSVFPQLLSNGLPYISAINQPPPVPDVVETPPNNDFSNPHMIHIDWLTGKAKIEENQF